ncbi:MAG: Ig-like domain-containing protein [Planctomycetes bacterium]|nr:Ig-like domain-containing protein [Planctomycetota bacterium]
MTDADIGTIYGSRDPAVAEVTNGGLVTARSRGSATILANYRGILGSIDIVVDIPNPLNEDCTASVLNRTVQVNPDGTFAIPNVPATSGLVRVRVTCERDDKVFAGASDLLEPIQNDDTVVGEILLREVPPIPVNIKLTSPKATFMNAGETAQLAVTGTLPDGNVRDFTPRSTGATYQSSNPNLGTVTQDGLYTTQANGTVVVTARNEGAIATIFLTNALGNDSDGDGLPNDFETQNGLNPSNAADAAQDADGDGLSNRDEFLAGTDLRVRDTDGDGLLDGDEMGRGSNPLAADTDGDGLLDRDEVLRGTDPRNRDTDGDGLPDGTEVAVGLDPLDDDSDGDGTLDRDEDSDGDGIRNSDELIEFTNPGDPDSDDDGVNDGEEVVAGADGFVTDPLNADTDGDGMRDGCETACAGLDPRDPADAGGDLDADGIQNLQECQGGTSPCQATDILGPRVVSVSPSGGATDVATNADVVLVFDEPVNPATVTAANFILFAGTTRLTPSILRSADNTTITLRGGLQAGTEHSVFVASRITDLQGNRGAEFSSVFTTGAPPDTARPSVVAVRPANGATAVSVSKCVTVFFSEPVSPGTVTGASFKLMAGANPVAATAVVDPGGTSATLCPDALLSFATTYSVSLTTAVQDPAGNALQAFASSFTTAADPAATRPTVVAIKPSASQQDVPTNAPVLAMFSEPVSPATVTGTSFAVSVAGGGAVSGTVTLEDGNTVARFTPAAPYPTSTNMNVRLLNTITDAAGNTLQNPQNFNFRTASGPDSTAPAVEAMSPVDGSEGLGTNALVMARFSEPLNPVSVNASSFRVSDDEGALVPCTIVFSRGDRVVAFTPQGPLDPDTVHTVSLSDRLIDLGGNPLAPGSFTFETGPGADVAFPQVLSVSPTNGAGGVPRNSRVALLFSRPISPVTIDATSIVVQGAAALPGAFSTNGPRTLVLFDPTADLEANRGHTVRALRLEVLDDNGNRLNGGASDFFSSFTAGSAADATGPSVLAVNPPDGTRGVGANAPVTLQFSEAVDVTSVGPGSLRVLRGGAPVEGTYTPSTDLTVVTFRPRAMLPVNALYAVDLAGGSYFDVAGNPGSGFASTFSTGGSVDLDFPVVTRVSPANGADDVPPNSPVSIELSEPVNPILVDAANFVVTASGLGVVPGTIAVSAGRTRATFTPMMPYPVNTFISVRVRRDITDDAGNRLNNGSDFASSFTTRYVTDAEAPAVASSNPQPGDVLVPLNTTIAVQFTEPIDTTTVTPASFAVSAGGQQIAGAFSYPELSSVVVFDPDAELPAGVEVQALVSGIRDLAGNALSGAFTLRFRTGTGVDTNFPAVVFTNPLQGATEVPLSAAIGATFSEAMSEVSIDRSTVVMSGSGAPPVGYSVAFDRSSGRRIEVVPDRPLLPFVTYTVRLLGTVTDRAGNRLQNGGGFSFSFTTGRQGDATGPTVVRTSPLDGATAVGANTPVVVELDEPVDPNSVSNETFLVRGGLVEILGTFSVSQDGRVASLQPFTFLRTGVEHEVRLDGITDVSGNSMAPYAFRFTTVDQGNLARAQGVLVNASTVFSASYPASNLVDGNLQSSWFTANNDPAPMAEIVFLEDVTVLGVNVLNPRSHPTGFDFLTARVKLLAGDRSVLSDSGVFALDEGGFQDKTLAFATISEVRRVLFEGVTWQSIEPGLAEIQVIGRFADPAKGVPDLELPGVTGVQPEYGATGVAVSTAPRVTFSKAMNPITFTSETSYLTVPGVGIHPARISFDAAAREVTLTPTVPLPGGRQVYVQVSNQVTDANGNRLASGHFSLFTTAGATDSSAPAVVSVDPSDGATGVSTTQLVTIRFSEPLSPPTIHQNNFGLYAAGARLGLRRFERSSDNTTVVLGADLPPSTLHVVYVTSDVTDVAGNPLAELASRFTTGPDIDTASPRVLLARPASGATGVPRDFGVHLFLSEPANPATLASGFFLSTATSAGGKLIAGSRTLSYGDLVATFQPSGPLAFATGHVVALRSSVQDVAGNALSNFSASFTTAEDPAANGPTAVAVTPASGAAEAPLNARVRVRFSEPVDRATVGASSLFLTASGIGAVAGTYGFEQGDAVVVFTPDAPLSPSRSHTINVRTGLRDLQGTPLRGNQGFSFTTGTAADAAAPSVTFVSPPDGSQGIGVNAPVSVQLTEPIDSITLQPQGLEVLDQEGALVPCAVLLSQDGRVVTFAPHAPLDPDEEHTVRVTAGVKDLAGNGLSPAVTALFRTAAGPVLDAPVVTRINIPNGVNDVPVSSPVIVEISRELNPITVSETTCTLTASGFGQLPAAVALSADRMRITLTPAMSMPVSRFVTLRVSGTVADDHGNELNGGSQFASGFTTEFLPDSTAPAVVAVGPPAGTTGVPLNAQVLVLFSEPMDPVSFDAAALTVSAGGNAVAGAVSLASGNTQAIWMPRLPLAAGTLHNVSLAGTVRDAAGNALGAPVASTFTTGSEADLTPPAFTDVSPPSGSAGVPTDVVVRLRFSERLNPATVSDASVVLNASGIGQRPAAVSLDASLTVMTVAPLEPLRGFTFHSLSVRNTVFDLAGNAFPGTGVSFTTGGEASSPGAPSVVRSHPANGASAAPSNAAVTLEFDREVDLLTANAATFRVLADGSDIPGTYATDGALRRLTFRPLSLYPMGSTVEATASGITDLSGTPMAAPFAMSFTALATGNLTQAPGVIANASSQFSASYPATNAFDGSLTTSWFTACGDSANQGKSPFIEAILPEDAAVSEIRVFGSRSHPNGFDFFSGVFQLFDASGTELYSSGDVALPAPDRDLTLAFAEVSGVRRGRFTATADQSCEPGLGELEIIGRYPSGLGIPDRLPPQMTATSPANGATGVALDATISMTFTEPMNPISFEGQVTLSASGTGTVPATLSLDASRKVLTFTPSIPLRALTFHSFVVTRSAVDDAGNQLGAGSGASFSFTSGGFAGADSTPPAIVAVTPADGSTGVYPNQPLTISFSEHITFSSLQDLIAAYSQGTRLTPSISRASSGLAVVLTASWPPGGQVFVVVSKDLADLAGNPLGADFVTSFTVGPAADGTAPRVQALRPTSGSSDIPVEKDIVLVLTEPVRGATAPGSVFLGGPDGKLVPIAVNLEGDGSILVIDPAASLAHDASHTVYVTSDLLDLAGNPFSPFSGTFRTAPDPTASAPRVLAAHPESGQTGVPLNAVVTARFSEPVNPATVTATTFSVTPSAQAALTGSFSFEEGDRLVRFTPSTPMLASHVHVVRITTGVQDTGGAALASQFAYSFTTGTASDAAAPAVVAVSPVDGETGVGVNAIISARFSEPVNPVTVSAATLRLETGAGERVPCAIFFEESNRAVHVVPNEPLAPSALHTITVEPAIADQAGNALGTDVMTTFMTAAGTDVGFPVVSLFAPREGSTDVPLNAVFRAQLSEPVSPVNVSEASVTLTASGIGAVAGAVTLSADRRLVTFTPSSPLSPSRVHTLRLAREIRDAAGNLLGNGGGGAASFTTGTATDGTAPVVTATSPEDGAGSVPRNAVIAVELSEPIDRTSVSHATVDLERGGADVAGSFELPAGERIVLFRPAAPLPAGAAHTLSVSGVLDVAGNPLGAPLALSFTTGAASDLVSPVVTSVTPANGATGVSRSTAITIGFSEPISPVNVNAATVRLIESGVGDIATAITVAPDRRSVTITPAALLTASKLFSVQVTNGVTDAARNPLQFFGSSFTTGP